MIFRALLGAHLLCAFGACLLFWNAAFSFKGGPWHRTAGEWFRRVIYATAASGGLLGLAAIVAPAWGHPPAAGQSVEAWTQALALHRQTGWVVLYVLLIIVVPTQHGLAVVAAGPQPARVRSRLHATLNLSCLIATAILLAACVVWREAIYLTLAPLGFAVGLRNMHYASQRAATPRDWEREHLTSLITAGVGVHTALLVFGVSRTLGLTLSPVGQLALWIGPALIGLPIVLWLRSRR